MDAPGTLFQAWAPETSRPLPSAFGECEGVAERPQEPPPGRPVGDGEDDVGKRPREVGLQRVPIEALRGGEPAHNAELLRELLGGARGPLRDIVLLNSAAALVVADRAGNLRNGIALAAESIDSGAARRVLDRLVIETNQSVAA